MKAKAPSSILKNINIPKIIVEGLRFKRIHAPKHPKEMIHNITKMRFFPFPTNKFTRHSFLKETETIENTLTSDCEE